MKKLLSFLPFAALFLAACSNDFEVTAPWKEIPVAYAIVSPADTAHYVRVEKAFLDPETDARVIAQIPDSLYYPESAIDVYLERASDGQSVHLTRVDGNLEGHVRDQGIFANQPNWLYKYKPATVGEFLGPGETARLIIVRNDGRDSITAQTTLPQNFQVRKPMENATPPQIDFEPDEPATFEWRTDIHGIYFNLTLRIEYLEQASNGQIINRDTLTWNMVRNVRRTDNMVGAGAVSFRGLVDISADQFYRFLTDNIQPASTACGGCTRHFNSTELIVEGGGEELEAYYQIASANSGITGAEVVPQYTNLSEGYGIFTGKNEKSVLNIRIGPNTINAMRLHPTAGLLNFEN